MVDMKDTLSFRILDLFFFFFLITKEPSMAKPYGLSMGNQTLRC